MLLGKNRMRDFTLILRARARMFLASVRALSAIRTASFVFVIACFVLGAYYIFFRVFGYLMSVEVIGPGLLDRLIEMALFVFFIMLLFSNVITSFSTFYNNRELDFLFSLPLPPTSIYLAKLLENCLYASWATLTIALPLIVAYGVKTGAPPAYYPLSIISVIIYMVIPAAIASALISILIRILPRLGPREVIMISLALVLGLTYLYIKINNPGLLKIFETENEQNLLLFAAQLTTVGGVYIPSTWLSNIMRGFHGNASGVTFNFLLLFFVSLSTILISFIIAKICYVRSWLSTGEHTSKRARRKSLLYRPQKQAAKTILFKDLLIFVREPTQWVQLSVFLILLVVYILSLRRTPIYFVFPLWRTIVAFANFAYISFVLATLGVRFIFPTVSLERAGIWFIGSSPISFRKVLLSKYLFNLITAVIIMEVLLLSANLFIKVGRGVYLLMPVIGLFVAASLVSINLGLGSRFPHFHEDNPSRIAAGSGGIIAALMSIAYVGASIVILASPAYNYLSHTFMDMPVNYLLVYSGFALFVIFSIFTIIMPLRIGFRSLERRDF
jgi:ABC-2 type transport system permease protein